MAFVDRVGRTTAVGRGTPRATAPAGGGFTVASAGPAAPSAAPAAASGVTLGAMLAMQEAESRAVRDREARRRGQDMLVALAALQHGLLACTADPDGEAAALGRLAALAGQVPEAADPGLRDAVAAVTLRVRVELARHGNVTG